MKNTESGNRRSWIVIGVLSLLGIISLLVAVIAIYEHPSARRYRATYHDEEIILRGRGSAYFKSKYEKMVVRGQSLDDFDLIAGGNRYEVSTLTEDAPLPVNCSR